MTLQYSRVLPEFGGRFFHDYFSSAKFLLFLEDRSEKVLVFCFNICSFYALFLIRTVDSWAPS
jgi:hypothetical protein